ncbi:MAG: LCP family protein [Clostridia bacterium]|nr:LCP family protein [Clostridia bacterium]MDD4387197.1 LCP family protein [Clostridia bacterium]
MNKKNKKNKVKGNLFTLFSKIFIVLIIIGILIWGGVYAVNYMIGEDVSTLNENEEISTTKKDVISALICGESENLTDTMIYVRYEVYSGKLAFMSIPRDTYVTNPYCIGHKLNAIYRGTNIEPLVKLMEDLLDVKIDNYLVVDNKIVREVVDVLGGVEIDVPFRMKYDDPEQDLHINLQPGLQVLDGAKAEQFIRFRHNNDMTVGYASGDIGRTKAQQDFIRAFIKEILSPSNIVKLPELIKAVLNNTDTNVTVREALRYVTDVPNLKLDDIYSCTAVGTTPTIDGLSYFKMDEEETQRIIKEDFIKTTDSTTDTTDVTSTPIN